MKNIRFFTPAEEVFDLPTKDFTDEMTIARIRYGYIDFYYDDTYDTTLVTSTKGFVDRGNKSVIFLNPMLITEENIAEIITHETLHLLIWKFEENIGSERIIRKILNEPISLWSFRYS